MRAADAIQVCREGSYEKVSPQHPVPRLPWARKTRAAEARHFVAKAQISSRPLAHCDDGELFDQLDQWIRAGTLAVVRETETGAGKQKPSSVQHRRVVRALSKTKGQTLKFEGRTYRMVADADLGNLSDREDYTVVGRTDALRVLEGLARLATPAEASLFQEARDQLSRDWRPPLSPDGIVLLRRIAFTQSARKSELPAGEPKPKSSGPAEAAAAPEEEETCRPCAALREAKQAEALREASRDGSPFCADCGTTSAATA